MAIYHLSAQIIGRSSGRSAVAAAAYRAHACIEDERTGIVHDYTRRHGDIVTFILAPNEAPDWVQDRAQLWNAVERAEKRINSQVAREINLALPVELTTVEQRALVQEFAQKLFVNEGMVADVAMHLGDPNNPHAHLLLTTRRIGADGFTVKNRAWNDRDRLAEWREQWASFVNYELRQKGLMEHQIDHRTLEAQGIDRLPQIHEGPTVRQMENRGIQTERGDFNRAVKEHARIVKEERTHIVELAAYRRERQALEYELAVAGQTQPEKTDMRLLDRHDALLREQTRMRHFTAVGREVYKLRSKTADPGLQRVLSVLREQTARVRPDERAELSGSLRAVREKLQGMSREQWGGVKARAITRSHELSREWHTVLETLATLRQLNRLHEEREVLQGHVTAIEQMGWIERLGHKNKKQQWTQRVNQLTRQIEVLQGTLPRGVDIDNLPQQEQHLEQRKDQIEGMLAEGQKILQLVTGLIRDRDLEGIAKSPQIRKKKHLGQHEEQTRRLRR